MPDTGTSTVVVSGTETTAASTGDPTPQTAGPTEPTSSVIDMGDVSGFDVIGVTLGDDRLTLALADSPELRSRGLMNVADLGALDGMLFSWGGETVNSRFTMRNTLIPLRIVFFDATGAFVSRADMVPCEVDECPTYGAAGPYAFAIEFPAGTSVSTGDRLVLDPAS